MKNANNRDSKGAASLERGLGRSPSIRKVLRLLVAAIAAIFISSRAEALELRIRNDFGNSLTSVVVFYDNSSGKWTTQGWYNVGPNSSKTFSLTTSKPDIYIHSLLPEANLTWGKGDVTRVVISNRFGYLDGEECPAGPNRRTVKFTKYTARNNVVTYRPVNNNGPLTNAGGFSAPLPSGGGSSGGPNEKDDLDASGLLLLINSDRAEAGLPTLKLDETLQRAATRRAAELTRKYSHDRPDGRSFDTVFAEFNLSPRASAENIAWRSGEGNTDIIDFNEAFMNSPGHRTNMLNRNYNAVGIGFAASGGRRYVVELFAGFTGNAGSANAAPQQSLDESFKELERSLKELGDLFK